MKLLNLALVGISSIALIEGVNLSTEQTTAIGAATE